MSIYALKGRLQDLLRPLVGRLAAAGVSANQVTVAAAVVSLLVAAVVWRWAPAQPGLYLLLPSWLLLRMALNAIDGMLAREFNQRSNLGAYLNETGDVVADAALYLSLLGVAGISATTVWLFVLAAALTEFTGVLAAMIGAARRYDGPMGKSDRAFLVGAIGLGLALNWLPVSVLNAVLAIAIALCLVTCIQRSRRALAAAPPPA